MHALLEGLPLDTVSTSMTINATAATLLCLYVAVADERGIARDKLSGTIQNDILKEYIARGTYIYPPAASMRLCADSFAWCARELPRWNTVSISGYHIREAGSDAVQEVAFTLADGIAYVEAARAAGLAVDAFAPRLSFFFNAHAHLLEEVAKFRAARRLWARIMRERFGAKDPRSLMLRFHAQTAGSTLTARRSAQQRRPHHRRGAGGGAGRRAVDPHQRLRRGAGAADRDLGAGGAADPADPGPRERRRRRGRSAGRRLRDRGAHLGDRGARARRSSPRSTGEAAWSPPSRPASRSARSSGGPCEHQRAVESGARVIVGVNRFNDGEQEAAPALHRTDPTLEAARARRAGAVAQHA